MRSIAVICCSIALWSAEGSPIDVTITSCRTDGDAVMVEVTICNHSDEPFCLRQDGRRMPTMPAEGDAANIIGERPRHGGKHLATGWYTVYGGETANLHLRYPTEGIRHPLTIHMHGRIGTREYDSTLSAPLSPLLQNH